MGNPFLVCAVLMGAICFSPLSGGLLLLTSRARKQRKDGWYLWSGWLGWFGAFAGVVFGGVLLSANVASFLPVVLPTDAPMTRTTFVYQNIFIAEGERVRFLNPKGANVQVLCVGTDGHCLSDENAPDELHVPGLRLLPNQAQTIQFLIPGTYTVLSLSTPGMSVTIHVVDPHASDGGP